MLIKFLNIHVIIAMAAVSVSSLPAWPQSLSEVLPYLQMRWQAALQTADPRTASWPLVESPFPMLALVALYLVVARYGPRIMKNRQPLELKPLMIIYNFALVLLSFYMSLELFLSARDYNYRCDAVDYSNEPKPLRMASVIWWYYFSKIIELLDTVFFILRKKNEQISFLHVYHHSTMVPFLWIGVKWYAGGSLFFSTMLNSGIHVIMYTYYLLSAFGPAVRKYLWWKKYLTMLQLLQFTIILIHVNSTFFISCDYDIKPRIAQVIYLFSHLALFSNFFFHAYMKPRGKKQTRETLPNDAPPTGVKRD